MDEITGKFAYVVSDQYGDYGLDKGDLVFIAGSGFSPVDEDDNYKLLFVVSKIQDDVPDMSKGVTIARKSLELLSDIENQRHLERMEESLAQRQEKVD